MKQLSLVLCAALLVAGCAQSPFGRGGDADAGAGIGAGASGVAPGSASDPTSVAYFRQSVGDRVLFLVDQSTLTPEGRAVLSAQAQWLQQNPQYAVTIEGHADEQGTREYNLALGARRAAAAQEFLVSQGIASTRINTVSYGKERPLEICSDEACYAQNRRAVTVLASGAGV